MTATLHDHGRSRALRAFPGRPGIWVQWHGDWHRPLRVWLYHGWWRITCHACMTVLRSGDTLYDDGWAAQAAAMDAAHRHCGECPAATPSRAVAP